jgi:glycosyltransferase involved in cell wall biosynthesis
VESSSQDIMTCAQHIVVVLDDLLGGGAARVATTLANAWVAGGRAVTLVTTDDGGRAPMYAHLGAVCHCPLHLRADSRNVFEGLWRNLQRVWTLRRAIQYLQPDILVSFLDRINVMSLLATRCTRRFAIIVSERTDPGARPVGMVFGLLRRLTYPWADAVVVQTARALELFPRRIRAKGVVIPNPVILPDGDAAQHEHPTARQPKTLVALGSLRRVKGHDLLLEAFARVAPHHPEWRLLIYGEGESRTALEAQVRALRLADRVRLPGATTDPFSCLRAADLFVLSSRTEGFPNALAEAMACGLPVVSFDCRSGPAEIIRQGLDGVLVPPEDVGALAANLDHLMGDDSERRRLAIRAPEVLKRFSLNTIIEKWEQVIQQAVRHNRPGSGRAPHGVG